jgi:hypothetical protein
VAFSIAMGYGLVGRGSIAGSKSFFCNSYRPYRLWDPPGLLSDGYRGGEKAAVG